MYNHSLFRLFVAIFVENKDYTLVQTTPSSTMAQLATPVTAYVYRCVSCTLVLDGVLASPMLAHFQNLNLGQM